MPHSLNPFTAALVVAAAVAVVLAVLMWRRGTAPGAREMATLWAACAIWCVTYLGEILAPSLPAKLRWLDVEYLGIASAPSAWMFFALRYSSEGRFPTRRQSWLLYVFPLITILVQWTNPLHGLLRREVATAAVGAMRVLDKAYGPWMWVHIAYSYAVMLVGSVALVRALPGQLPLFRSQRALVLSACALPWVASIVYMMAPVSWTRLDATPLSMIASGALCAWALFRFGFLDLVPAARDAIIEELQSGLLVADTRGRLVDLNPAAAAFLGVRRGAALGRPLDEALHAHTERMTRDSAIDDGHEHLAARGECGQVYLEVRRTPLRDPSGRLGGEVVTVTGVTERHRAHREREALISSLQRALAEVRTLGGLLPICAHCKRIRDDEGYWTRLEEYITHHSGAEFTHGICPDCLRQMYPDLVDVDPPPGDGN